MQLNKILFVTPYVGIDTPQTLPFAKLLMAAMSDLGIEVMNLPVSKTVNPLRIIEQIKSLRRLIRTFKPQIVVASYGTYTGLLVAIFSQGPKVVIYRGSDLNPQPSMPKAYRFAQHTASHIASFLVDGIICVSNELLKRLWVTNKPCAIIPDPTNLGLFQPLCREDCRIKLGWDADSAIAVFFGFGGRKEKRTDLATIIQNKILTSGSNVELKIIFEAPLSQMPVYLNAADCLLFLSDSEGSPNLIRDACACNLPIVSVRVGDVDDVLKSVTPSKIVQRDVDAITEQVINIAKLRTRSNGREHVMQYGKEIITRKHIEFYSSFLKNDQQLSEETR
ncbi:MAG: glycosyltransferase [Desulfomonilaceae bacterium]